MTGADRWGEGQTKGQLGQSQLRKTAVVGGVSTGIHKGIPI